MLKKQHLTPRERLGRAKERLGKSKGSVLFFVLAIMSVMIVMAAAVYYAVASARQEVEAKYASEQAYQSAISINDMVSDYIARDPDNKFVSSALALANGDSIKTEVTDLATGVGNVSVTITKISGGAGSAILSITTETVVNGETQVVTSVGELTESSEEDEPATLSRFFTSTGYVPNDTIFSSGEVTSELYLDSEYTELAGQQGSTGGIDIMADIISSGTVRFNNAPINGGGTKGKKIDITIGNDCYFYFPAGLLDLGGGTLRVGGSVVQLANCYAFNKNTNVYIQGDLYSGTAMGDNADHKMFINGNLIVADSFKYNGEIYVNGDVFLNNNFNQGVFAGKLHVGGNVYVDKNSGLRSNQLTALESVGDIKGKIIQSDEPVFFSLNDQYTVYEAEETIERIINANSSENGGKSGYTYIWPSNSGKCESMDVVTKTIKDTLGNSKYINWDLDKLFRINENPNNPYIDTTDIVFKFENWKDTYDVTLSAKDADKYIIQDIEVQSTNYNHALIFDTDDGSGGYKDIYVMLKPNGYYDKASKQLFLGRSGSTNYTITHYHYKCNKCNAVFDSNYDATKMSGCPECGTYEQYTKIATCSICNGSFAFSGTNVASIGACPLCGAQRPKQFESTYTCQECNHVAEYTGNIWELTCEKCGAPAYKLTAKTVCLYCNEESSPDWRGACPKCLRAGQYSLGYKCNLCDQNVGETKPNGACPKCNVSGVVTNTGSDNEEKTVSWTENDLNAFQFGDSVPESGQSKPNNGMPFHVLVKGKGSVIFVIPQGETYVARNQSYVGHYALYKEITGQSIEDAEAAEGGFKSSNDGAEKLKGFETDGNVYIASNGRFTQAIIDKYGDSGEKLYLHNNVFLVSVEKNVSVDFDVPETIFGGMIYAPYMQFNCTNSASNRVLFGGLVVSNYNLEGSAKYLYGAPYDYYDRFVPEKNTDGSALTEEQKQAQREKYLANLMGQTGSNQFLPEGGSGQIGRAWNRFGYN